MTRKPLFRAMNWRRKGKLSEEMVSMIVDEPDVIIPIRIAEKFKGKIAPLALNDKSFDDFQEACHRLSEIAARAKEQQ